MEIETSGLTIENKKKESCMSVGDVTYLGPGFGITSSAELIVGNVVGDGIGLSENEAVRSLERGNFAKREFFKELGRLVSLPKNEVLGNCDLCPAVLGSDQSLEGTEIVRVGVEGLRTRK